jgi:hypothetical protein
MHSFILVIVLFWEGRKPLFRRRWLNGAEASGGSANLMAVPPTAMPWYIKLILDQRGVPVLAWIGRKPAHGLVGWPLSAVSKLESGAVPPHNTRPFETGF